MIVVVRGGFRGVGVTFTHNVLVHSFLSGHFKQTFFIEKHYHYSLVNIIYGFFAPGNENAPI